MKISRIRITLFSRDDEIWNEIIVRAANVKSAAVPVHSMHVRGMCVVLCALYKLYTVLYLISQARKFHLPWYIYTHV
jgi:hypothetical protein